jgi:5-methyltetrahydropteroyltriglutamate--homocysteine methyltransferase
VIETPEEVASVLEAVMNHVPAHRIFPCTNCGMVPLARDVASAKLRALTAGTLLVKGRL